MGEKYQKATKGGTLDLDELLRIKGERN